jgi:ketosteroid isomerase-like protein
VSSVEERLAAVEARQAIGQLVARYAVAVDGRDLDALVALFAIDVDCGRWGQGRDALRAFYDKTLRGFGRSIHLVSAHVIDLGESGRATGVTYCRAEHEAGDEWVVQTFAYFDTYEVSGGGWTFRRRELGTWYANDITQRPAGPDFVRWPHVPPGRLPDRFPHWAGFWAAAGGDASAA